MLYFREQPIIMLLFMRLLPKNVDKSDIAAAKKGKMAHSVGICPTA